MKDLDILSTGEIAKICGVAPRTVSKWIDSGQLKGYRIPSSQDRRATAEDLRDFLKSNRMPTTRLDKHLHKEKAKSRSVMCVAMDNALAKALKERIGDRYLVVISDNMFDVGGALAKEEFQPIVLLGDHLGTRVMQEVGAACVLQGRDTVLILQPETSKLQGRVRKVRATLQMPVTVEDLVKIIAQINKDEGLNCDAGTRAVGGGERAVGDLVYGKLAASVPEDETPQ